VSVVAPRPAHHPGSDLVRRAQRPGSDPWRCAAVVGVIALAAALRLVGLARTPLDPFYDASVRSMGQSAHAFLVGAFDPSARLAIDKPPVDLWLQVATTRVLGFTPTALLLPAAIGGTLAVVFLYDLLRTLFGPRAALAGAAVLAVLPVAVITSRSDTMDSVMAALLVAALAIAARGLREARTRNVVLAGALVGLAFEVKLFEALLGVVPLAILWWCGARTSRRRRALGLAGAGAAAAAVGIAWLLVLTLAVPAHDRPWAFGSTNGSAWNATFVYDGWDRIAGAKPPPTPPVDPASHPSPAKVSAAQLKAWHRHLAAAQRAPGPPGPLRLLSSQAHLGARIGLVLAAALAALGALAVAARRRPLGLDRTGRAGLAALAAWLAAGLVLFCAQPGLRPRYLEAFDPAVAACLGAGVVLAAGAARGRRRGALAATLLAAVLAVPLGVSAAAVGAHVQDSGAPGLISTPRLAALSAYLRRHEHGARYETASVAVAKAGPIIARDGRPVLMLTGTFGHPLVSTRTLARLVAAGAVRSAIVGNSCTVLSPDRWFGCSAPARWIRAHGTDVSAAAGQPHRGFVYALSPARVSRAARRGRR
jgi:4-amino-4-deoxy-L-arabinose transferase-like glycosyltransferase